MNFIVLQSLHSLYIRSHPGPLFHSLSVLSLQMIQMIVNDSSNETDLELLCGCCPDVEKIKVARILSVPVQFRLSIWVLDLDWTGLRTYRT